jgi:hypothetical protein
MLHGDGPVPCGPVPCGPVPCGPVPCGPVPCGPVPWGLVACGDVPRESLSRGALPPPVLASKLSSALIASWTADATAPPAPESCPPMPGLVSRIRRAARQMGHHWHSGASPTSGGISCVAVSHTSAVLVRPPPIVRRTCPPISFRTFLAPWRMSQRCRSPTGSTRGGGLCRARSAAGRPGPGRSAPGRCGPGRSAPGRSAPGRSVPGCSVPGRSDGSEGPDCSVIGVTIS